MNRIDNITDQANQVTQAILADGSILQMELIFHPAVERWVINLSHPLLVLEGVNLCIHPNVLRQWRHIINFGLACVSTDGVDPFDIQDFTDGRVSLFTLSEQEVQTIETTIFGSAFV